MESSYINYVFEEAAAYYNIDLALLMGIATLESGFGTSEQAVLTNNWFGWQRDNGKLKCFTTVAEGVYYVAQKISERPHKTVWEVVEWYNFENTDFWGSWMQNFVDNFDYEPAIDFNFVVEEI